MKISAAIAALKPFLANDADISKASAALLAADKKGKDSNEGLGPKEIEKKGADKARDEDMPEGMDAKAWDAMSDEEKETAKDEFEKKAEDADKDDPEKTNDEEIDVKGKDDVQPSKTATGNSGAGGKEPTVDAKAMDAAIKGAIDSRDALHAARREVESVIGIVAFDSADAVYKAALDKLGVDSAGVHKSAFPTLFRLALGKVQAETPVFAADAARVKSMAGAIKGYNRLS
jgi:hypothetical protein